MARKLVTVAQKGLSRSDRKLLKALEEEALKGGREQAAVEVESLPPTGSVFPNLRTWTPRVKPPAHRGTGWEFAAANVFAGADVHHPLGPVIGIELLSGGSPFTFDPWNMYERELVSSPNLLIQGGLRRGKSFFVKRFVTQQVLYGRIAINTSDSKGEHGVVAEALGGTVFKVGDFESAIKINALEQGERHHGESEKAHETRTRAARQLVLQQVVGLLMDDRPTPAEKGMLNWALEEVVRETNNHPTIRLVVNKLASDELSSARNGRYLPGAAVRLLDAFDLLIEGDLRGMFEDESTVKLDPNCPYTVIDTSAMAQRGDLALALTQTISNAWVQATISNKTSVCRYVLIREEGWRDMNTVEALEFHRLQLKLSGDYLIIMVLVVHEDGDFDAVGPKGSKEREIAQQLLRGYANVVSFYQKKKALKLAVEQATFTEGEAELIGQLGRGQFLLKTDYQSFLVDGTATATDWEKRLFHTDGKQREAA